MSLCCLESEEHNILLGIDTVAMKTVLNRDALRVLTTGQIGGF
jgi:hypothetical protein